MADASKRRSDEESRGGGSSSNRYVPGNQDRYDRGWSGGDETGGRDPATGYYEYPGRMAGGPGSGGGGGLPYGKAFSWLADIFGGAGESAVFETLKARELAKNEGEKTDLYRGLSLAQTLSRWAPKPTMAGGAGGWTGQAAGHVASEATREAAKEEVRQSLIRRLVERGFLRRTLQEMKEKLAVDALQGPMVREAGKRLVSNTLGQMQQQQGEAMLEEGLSGMALAKDVGQVQQAKAGTRRAMLLSQRPPTQEQVERTERLRTEPYVPGARGRGWW